MLELIKKRIYKHNHSYRNTSLAWTGVVVGSTLVYYLLKRNHVI